MDPVGIAIGALGLAGLFSTCLDCFDLVQRGRFLGKEYILLETKFNNLRLRFLTWGRACGLTESQGYDARLDEDGLHSCVTATLSQLFYLFKDGAELQRRYGLRDEHKLPRLLALASPLAVPALDSLAHVIPERPNGFVDGLHRLRNRIHLTQKSTSMVNKARWAISDKDKFLQLISHLKDLIEDLEGITKGLGIAQRQQELVRDELESVNDVFDLRYLEEAHMGEDDFVSHAASLRLSQLRLQIEPLEHEGDSSQHRQADPVSIEPQLSTEDWELLSSYIPETSGLQDRPFHQTLYRILCKHEPTAVYFDPPTYTTRTEWESVECENSAARFLSFHLSGQRQVDNLEAYLSHNKHLHFVVFEEHQCSHSPNPPHGKPLPSKHSLRLLSMELGSALQALFRNLDFKPGLPSCQLDEEFTSPFFWYYHTRLMIQTILGCQSKAEAGPSSLPKKFFSILDSLTEKDYMAVDTILSQEKITIEYLGFLFVPDEIVISTRNGKSLAEIQAYNNKSWVDTKMRFGKTEMYIETYSWTYRRNFHKLNETLTIGTPEVTPKSEFAITDLTVYPLKFAPKEIEKALTRRGRLFWKCRHRNYVCYRGPVGSGDIPSTDGSRYIIDFLSYLEMNDLGKSSFTPGDLGPTVEALEDPDLGPEFFVCLPTTLNGFSMERRKWEVLFLEHIENVAWNDDVVDLLSFSSEQNKLLQAIASNKIGYNMGQLEAIPLSRHGLFMLFFGPPGVGKTTTAEKIAEVSHRPLLRVTCADLGTTVEELEKNIHSVFSIGNRWDCVVLLDEVDSLLLRHDPLNVERNTFVSVFLRELESYRGILICTCNTSRTQKIDPAILSRVHLSLPFSNLDDDQRGHVWSSLVNQLKKPDESTMSSEPPRKGLVAALPLGSDDVGADVEGILCHIRELASLNMNGRQIRNTILTARQLASHLQQPLGFEHLQNVIMAHRELYGYSQQSKNPIFRRGNKNSSL